MSFLSAIRQILENISGSMQAVHHWHSEKGSKVIEQIHRCKNFAKDFVDNPKEIQESVHHNCPGNNVIFAD